MKVLMMTAVAGLAEAFNNTQKIFRFNWLVSVTVIAMIVAPIAHGALVSYFDFEEGSGNPADSVSGNDGGTLSANVAWTNVTSPWVSNSSSLAFPGQPGGNGQRVLVSGSTPGTYVRSTAPFTVSAWIKPDSIGTPSTYPMIAVLPSDGAPLQFFLNNSGSGYHGINIGGSSTFKRLRTTSDPIPTLLDGNWHHILVTFDGVDANATSSYAIYLDGTSWALGNSSAYVGASAGLQIGAEASRSDMNFDGLIGELAVFDTALSTNQIAYLKVGNSPKTLPAAAAPIPEANIVTYVAMEEGSGSITFDGIVGNDSLAIQGGTPAVWSNDVPSAATHIKRSLFFPGNSASSYTWTLNGTSPGSYVSTNNPFTISTWFKSDDITTDATYPSIVTIACSGRANQSAFQLLLSAVGGYAGISIGSRDGGFKRIRTTGITDPEATLGDNQWHNIIVTFDGLDATATSSFAIYLDGVSQTLGNGGTYSDVNDTSLVFGGRGDPSSTFNGLIGELVLFDKLLADYQRRDLVDGASPGNALWAQPKGTVIVIK